ncbi:MAG: nucleoside deaminase [bacterium]|nr:nucleoside deaminase [bacterium]
MNAALEEAERGLREQEVPIGAVVVQGETIIGRGHNQVEAKADPTAHAEIMALRQAGSALGEWRLTGCRIYVTVEPCLMCLGAIRLAKISQLIYALREPKSGAVRSKIGAVWLWGDGKLEVIEGVGRERSLSLLQSFFAQLRNDGSRRGTEVWP